MFLESEIGYHKKHIGHDNFIMKVKIERGIISETKYICQDNITIKKGERLLFFNNTCRFYKMVSISLLYKKSPEKDFTKLKTFSDILQMTNIMIEI